MRRWALEIGGRGRGSWPWGENGPNQPAVSGKLGLWQLGARNAKRLMTPLLPRVEESSQVTFPQSFVKKSWKHFFRWFCCCFWHQICDEMQCSSRSRNRCCWSMKISLWWFAAIFQDWLLPRGAYPSRSNFRHATCNISLASVFPRWIFRKEGELMCIMKGLKFSEHTTHFCPHLKRFSLLRNFYQIKRQPTPL